MELIINSKAHGIWKILYDKEDHKIVFSHNWYVNKFTNRSKNCIPRYYAYTNIKEKRIGMHTFILSPSKGQQVDHIIHREKEFIIDNRRSNLRLATVFENSGNQRVRVNNTSGFKGVSFDRRKSKIYRAYIVKNNKQIHLGNHSDIIDAAKAYDKAAVEVFGEFALTNKMMNLY